MKTMFEELLNDEVNNVVIHVLEKSINSFSHNQVIPCSVTDLIVSIKKKHKLHSRKFTSYWNSNLEYIYEESNDNQCIFKNILINSKIYDKYLINAYQQVKQPVYMFPCTNNISYKEQYVLEELKINNRISLFIKNNSVYVNFKYSTNCDIETNMNEINSILQSL